MDKGLLEKYAGAAAAYSVRLLDRNYTGPIFKIRRVDVVSSQSNGEIFVFPDDEGWISVDSKVIDPSNASSATVLGEFVNAQSYTQADSSSIGSNPQHAFVSIWKDQSGNANDASQSTANNQPKIYDATTGVITDNGKPTVEFSTAGNSKLVFTQISDIQTIFTVRSSSGVQSRSNFMGASGTNDYRSSSGALLSSSAASYVTGGNNYINGTLTTYTTTAKPTTQSLFTMIHSSASGRSDQLTQDRSNSVRSWDGPFSEIVIYRYDESDNRAVIEDDINKALIFTRMPQTQRKIASWVNTQEQPLLILPETLQDKANNHCLK